MCDDENLFSGVYDASIVEADILIDAYTDIFPGGGRLHIILEDGNTDDADINMCKDRCDMFGDVIGGRICNLLLKLPPMLRDIVCRNNDYKWGTIITAAKIRLAERLMTQWKKGGANE